MDDACLLAYTRDRGKSSSIFGSWILTASRTGVKTQKAVLKVGLLFLNRPPRETAQHSEDFSCIIQAAQIK